MVRRRQVCAGNVAPASSAVRVRRKRFALDRVAASGARNSPFGAGNGLECIGNRLRPTGRAFAIPAMFQSRYRTDMRDVASQRKPMAVMAMDNFPGPIIIAATGG